MTNTINWISLTLPSHGVFYDGKLPDGKVEIRTITAQEESVLFSQGMSGIERMARLIDSCCRLPDQDNFSYKIDGLDTAFTGKSALLMSDRMGLLLGQRIHALGANYDFSMTCSACGETVRTHIDLVEDLNVRDIEAIELEQYQKGIEDWKPTEPLQVKLPDAGVTVALRFLRGNDEVAIMKQADQLRMQSVDVADPSYLYRIQKQIIAVDGEKQSTLAMHKLVRSLTIKDTTVIRNTVQTNEPGVDLRIMPRCRSCGAINERMLPLTGEFFQPTSV